MKNVPKIVLARAKHHNCAGVQYEKPLPIITVKIKHYATAEQA